MDTIEIQLLQQAYEESRKKFVNAQENLSKVPGGSEYLALYADREDLVSSTRLYTHRAYKAYKKAYKNFWKPGLRSERVKAAMDLTWAIKDLSEIEGGSEFMGFEAAMNDLVGERQLFKTQEYTLFKEAGVEAMKFASHIRYAKRNAERQHQYQYQHQAQEEELQSA